MLRLKLILFVFALALVTDKAKGEWRWDGKVAVVTGASSGIGAEIAVTLAEKGVIVVGLARREEKIKDLLKRTNGTIHAVKCDLLQEEEILKTFRWIEKTLGGVDILVNNAGTLIVSTLTSGNTADWRTVMDLNVLATSICSREALKSMRNRGDNGHIININSVVGHMVPKIKTFPTGLYSASKFAVTSLTETLAFELAEKQSKIKVTSLSPGLVSTELVYNITASYLKSNPDAVTSVLSEPFIEPIDIAEGVVYVLSTRPNVQIAELTIQPVAKPL